MTTIDTQLAIDLIEFLDTLATAGDEDGIVFDFVTVTDIVFDAKGLSARIQVESDLFEEPADETEPAENDETEFDAYEGSTQDELLDSGSFYAGRPDTGFNR